MTPTEFPSDRSAMHTWSRGRCAALLVALAALVALPACLGPRNKFYGKDHKFSWELEEEEERAAAKSNIGTGATGG